MTVRTGSAWASCSVMSRVSPRKRVNGCPPPCSGITPSTHARFRSAEMSETNGTLSMAFPSSSWSMWTAATWPLDSRCSWNNPDSAENMSGNGVPGSENLRSPSSVTPFRRATGRSK